MNRTKEFLRLINKSVDVPLYIQAKWDMRLELKNPVNFKARYPSGHGTTSPRGRVLVNDGELCPTGVSVVKLFVMPGYWMFSITPFN